MAISDSTAERYRQADPDVRLMLKVRDDDASAFEALMGRYQDRVVGLLTHLVGSSDQAEDLAQDVFLRVYRSRKRYKPGSKFSTWLFTITHNVASNARRGLARRKEINLTPQQSGQSSFGALEGTALDASGLMPNRQLDNAELREIVRLAIETLGDNQREAVLLNKFEHLSYAEIAEVMGLSTKAVKSLLSRARGNLREVLDPYLHQDGAEPDLS